MNIVSNRRLCHLRLKTIHILHSLPVSSVLSLSIFRLRKGLDVSLHRLPNFLPGDSFVWHFAEFHRHPSCFRSLTPFGGKLMAWL